MVSNTFHLSPSYPPTIAKIIQEKTKEPGRQKNETGKLFQCRPLHKWICLTKGRELPPELEGDAFADILEVRDSGSGASLHKLSVSPFQAVPLPRNPYR